MYNVAVLGAGVIGLTTALNLQEKYPNVKVTVITEKTSPHTTGDVSAGLWGPYLLGSTPLDKIIKWSKATHDYLQHLWKSGLAASTGVSLQPCIRILSAENDEIPAWKSIVYGYVDLNKSKINELINLNKPNCSKGAYFVTFTCEPSKWLPFLTDQFIKAGGKLKLGKVESITSLANHYDAVVNCCGLGARELANDSQCHPIRGQVTRVKAPWLYYTYIDENDDGNYIIPNEEDVILGGTHQEGDEDLNPRYEDNQLIMDGCQSVIPALKHAPLIKESVGLRPGRHSVRLKREIQYFQGKPLHVIHNYGHGGSGVTLSWGCALDATNLVADALNLTSHNSKCKL